MRQIEQPDGEPDRMRDAEGAAEITFRRVDGSIAGVRRFANGRELNSVVCDEKTCTIP